MNNITILKNMPQEIIDTFKTYYNENFKNVEPQSQWSDIHYADSIPRDDAEELKKLFKTVDIHAIEIYTVLGPRRMSPHIDRGRSCAIQIPVDVDLENNYTYAVKGDNYKDLIRPGIDHRPGKKDIQYVNDVEHYFFKWDPDRYDTYNLEYPVLQNTSVPHGGHNLNNSTRKFFSLTIKHTPYIEAKEQLKEWA